MREFVPYKVAVRIKDTISFSTRLDARDDALRLSKKTMEELDKRDAALDRIYAEKISLTHLTRFSALSVFRDLKRSSSVFFFLMDYIFV